MPSPTAFEANLSFPTSNQVIEVSNIKCSDTSSNYGDPGQDLSLSFIGPIMEHLLKPTQDKNATYLNLSNLKLKTLPILAQRLKQLRYLDLSYNPLDAKEFKGPNYCGIGVKYLLHLDEVVLEHCQLGELPQVFLQCKNLRILRLHGNKIDRLNHSFTDLKWLAELDLSSNHLIALPETIKNLINLTHLNLSENKFEFFPEEVLLISSLESLILNRNRILFLPNNLDMLTNLKILRLAYNKLDDIPKTMPPQLICLDLFGNLLHKLSFRKPLEALEHFDADFNYAKVPWNHYDSQKNRLRSGLKEMETINRFKFPTIKKWNESAIELANVPEEIQDTQSNSRPSNWDSPVEKTSQSLSPFFPILYHAPFIQKYLKREYDPQGSQDCFEDAD